MPIYFITSMVIECPGSFLKKIIKTHELGQLEYSIKTVLLRKATNSDEKVPPLVAVAVADPRRLTNMLLTAYCSRVNDVSDRGVIESPPSGHGKATAVSSLHFREERSAGAGSSFSGPFSLLHLFYIQVFGKCTTSQMPWTFGLLQETHR